MRPLCCAPHPTLHENATNPSAQPRIYKSGQAVHGQLNSCSNAHPIAEDVKELLKLWATVLMIEHVDGCLVVRSGVCDGECKGGRALQTFALATPHKKQQLKLVISLEILGYR